MRPFLIRPTRVLHALRWALHEVGSVALSALVWFVIAAGLGIALVLSGVHALFGEGWSMVAGGIASLIVAWFISRGIANG